MAIGTETETEIAPPRSAREKRWTVCQYLDMIEAGIIRDKERVFLWKGRIVEKMGRNWPHSKGVLKLLALVFQIAPPGYFVQPEQPMVLGDDSMPEPDFTVVRGTLEDYGPRRRPSAADVALIVEVSDSTLAEDRGEALESYAAAGIPVYWIVNLRANALEVYTEPTGPADLPRYRTTVVLGPADEVAVILDGLEVARLVVRDILP